MIISKNKLYSRRLIIHFLAYSLAEKSFTIIHIWHPSNLDATKLVTHPVDSMVEKSTIVVVECQAICGGVSSGSRNFPIEYVSRVVDGFEGCTLRSTNYSRNTREAWIFFKYRTFDFVLENTYVTST